MSLPIQPAAYNDCYAIWEAAASTRGGGRTPAGTYAQALYLRQRMHQARSLLRDQSRRAYPKDHPLWNTSTYDEYKIVLKVDDENDYWLYVEHHGNWNAVAGFEPIPEDEMPALPPSQGPPPRLLSPVAVPGPLLEHHEIVNDELE